MKRRKKTHKPVKTKKPKKGFQHVPRMEDDELRKFVLGWCDGKLFSTAHEQLRRQPHHIPSVFMVAAFGGFADCSKTYLDEIGIIWEWIDEALPRAINGMPMFMSCKVMHKEDWSRARVAINNELDRRREIQV